MVEEERIEIPCDRGTEGLWRALGAERRAHVARLFVATVCAQARLEAEELAVRLRELRRETEAAPVVKAEPEERADVPAPPATNGQRWGVKDNGDGTATVVREAADDLGMERVRERFDAARAEQRVTRPTDALPRGRTQVQRVQVTDEAVVDVVRRLKFVSKSRVAIELGYRPGSKGYVAVGDVLARLATPGAGGPLVEGGRIRNGVGYRLRPASTSPAADDEGARARGTVPPDHRGVSPRHDPAARREATTPDAQAIERDRVREREGLRNAGLLGAPSPRRTTPAERPARDSRPPVAERAPEQPTRTDRAQVQASVVPFAGTEEELREEVVRMCSRGKRGVGGIAEELKVPPGRVAQAVQWLVQRGELVKQPPGVYSAAAARAA